MSTPTPTVTTRRWYSADSTESVERVYAAWKDAPLTNAELLGMLLDVAREQVLEYAPDSDPVDEIRWMLEGYGFTSERVDAAMLALGLPGPFEPNTPVRYIYAQLQQTKNLWNAGRVMGNGEAGADGFSFAPRPLDKDIQRIIRPIAGVPSVF